MKNRITLTVALLLIGFFSACDEEDTAITEVGVDFKADVQNIDAGEEVNYDDLSIGNVSRWDWTFEGGTPPTSNLKNPTVVYNSPGSYSVSLRASSSASSGSLTKESFIVVSAPQVVADFTVSVSSAIEGENVVFTDTSSGSPTSWSWEFIPESGTTITSDEQNPVVSFSEASTYSVRLSVSNSDNTNEIVRANVITIIDVTSIEASFQVDSKNTYTGNTVNFTDTSVGTSNRWSWTFEGGTPATSTEQNPVVTYDTPGRYNVSFTAFNDINSSTVDVTDYVIVVPGDGLVAYFPLNGNANDAGPNGIGHEILGTVDFTGMDRNSVENGTASFDGASLISITDNAAMNFETSNLTIGIWLKTSTSSRMMVYQESGKDGGGDQQTWFRLNDNADSRVVRAAMEDSTGGAILNIPDADLPGGLDDDIWHFVTVVREGDDLRLYVDGVLIGERTGASKDVSSEQNFSLGAQASGDSFSNYYNGQLDDLILFNKALTETEIIDLYQL